MSSFVACIHTHASVRDNEDNILDLEFIYLLLRQHNRAERIEITCTIYNLMAIANRTAYHLTYPREEQYISIPADIIVIIIILATLASLLHHYSEQLSSSSSKN